MLLLCNGTYGTMVAFGHRARECNVPPLGEGISYMFLQVRNTQLSLHLLRQQSAGSDSCPRFAECLWGGTCSLTCWSLAGHEVLCFAACASDLAVDIQKQIAEKLDENLRIRVVSPDGHLPRFSEQGFYFPTGKSW